MKSVQHGNTNNGTKYRRPSPPYLYCVGTEQLCIIVYSSSPLPPLSIKSPTFSSCDTYQELMILHGGRVIGQDGRQFHSDAEYQYTSTSQRSYH